MQNGHGFVAVLSVLKSLIKTAFVTKRKFEYISFPPLTNINTSRPDFVAILGVLSRDEIESYAARTLALRESRRSPRNSLVPPIQPPRPLPRKRSVHFDDEVERRRDKDTPSDTDSSTHSERERPRERVRARDILRDHRPNPSYPPASAPLHYLQAQYANPMTPPQFYPTGPPMSPQQQQQAWGQQSPIYVPVPYYVPTDDRGSQKNRQQKETRSRWRDNLTAASIGGAAASLLSVLSEAAADIAI